ncbi:MAG: hypothetical protein ACREFQ_15085, partial [Stellaceae bacterium]
MRGTLLAALVAAYPLIGGAHAEPVKLRIAWTTVVGQMATVLFQKTDLLQNYGKSYTVDPVYYKGSGPQITALASGQLEIAEFAPNALALSVENAGISDVRVIGDATRD